MRKLFSTIILLFITLGLYAQDVSFTASAPGAVAAGKRFRISYTLNATGSDLRVPAFKNFKLLAGPSTSNSVSIVNGDVSRQETYSYIVLAQQSGVFTIDPATVKVKGKTYKSNALKIEVVASGASPTQNTQSNEQPTKSQQISGLSNKDLFIRYQVSKTDAYMQEAFVLTLKMYSRVNVVDIADSELPQMDGFLSLDIEIDNTNRAIYETVNGLNYRTRILKQTLLIPQKLGKQTIEAAKLVPIIRVKSGRRGMNVFDDFFSTYQDVKKNLTSNAIEIDVKNFPTANRPADFTNGVGQFTLASSIDKTKVKANEPVTLRVTIAGKGNLKLLPEPNITFPGDFETYDPKVTNKLNTNIAGMSGSRTYEYLVIPRFSGQFEIPAYSFSYFDPQTKTYKSLATDSYSIEVEKGVDDLNQSTVSTYSNSKEELKFLGKDIRYIKTKGIKLKTKGEFIVGSTLFWLAYILPLVLFIVMYLIYQKQLKENANVVKVKNKRANKIARKRLKTSEQLLKQNQKEAFYDEILKAVWGYTSDKLNIPVANLNKESIHEELSSHQVKEETLKELMDILDTCEFARYAPVGGSDEMAAIYKRTIVAISSLESQIK